MIQFRLSVALPGLDAGALTAIAPEVEAMSIHELWYGDPTGRDPLDASYVITALAAVGAVTRSIRLGAFVDLERSSGSLWLAEDLGVLDAASNGRVTLGLAAPQGPREPWLASARRALTAWQGWQVADTEVPVTPLPAQSFLPRLVADACGLDAADELGAGLLVGASSHPPRDERLRRIAVTAEVEHDDVEGWLRDDVGGALRGLAPARSHDASRHGPGSSAHG